MLSYLQTGIKTYFQSYHGLPIAFWQRIAVSFINNISAGVVFFLSFYFVKTLHLNIALAGLMISVYGIGTVIGGYVSGKLSQHIPSNAIAIISLLCKTLAFFALARFHTVNFLFVDLFILGVTTYGFKTANYIWVLTSCKSHEAEKFKTINVLYATANLGIGLAGVIVSFLGARGFEDVFYLAGILLFLSLIYFIFHLKTPIQFLSSIEHTAVNYQNKNKSQLKNIKIIWLVLFCLFLVGIIISQRSTTYLVYVHDLFPELGTKGIGLLFTINPLIIVLFQTFLASHLLRFNKILIVGIGALLMGLGMLMLTFSVIFSLAIIACVVYTLGEMCFFAMAQLLVYQYSREEDQSYNLGLFQAIYALGMVSGPALGGFIYHHLGGDMVWTVSGFLGLVCFVGCYYYKRLT